MKKRNSFESTSSLASYKVQLELGSKNFVGDIRLTMPPNCATKQMMLGKARVCVGAKYGGISGLHIVQLHPVNMFAISSQY